MSRWLRLLCVAFTAWTGAAEADTYIILSLVGDHVTVVSESGQTGSRFDQNKYEVMPLSEPVLDDFAVRVADATIAKVRPDATVITLRAGDPALYALRDSWLDSETIEVKALVSLITKQFPPSPDTHLLLITPYRAEIELRTAHDYRGSGKVAGLGFYLNGWTRFRRSDNQESARGFLGIFANFQLVLINLQTNAIEAHERIVVGTTEAAARAADRTPWNALTSQQKSRVLEFLMKREIERALPGMLSSRRP
ncbi:MAG: hypothetical protein E6H64_10450 [Betaproteobacteria bacterium]|nr:MAG: hypothetical protein E6H64_10450 [Betaproteobacteria bacterium]